MINFVWPWVFAALPLPWLVRKLAPPAAPLQGAALRLPFFREWVSAGSAVDGISRPRGRWMAYLAWLLLVVAAAQPQWVGEPVEVPVSGRDMVLAVDLSGSMDRADFTLGGEQVNRLAVVKAVAGEFITRRSGDRLGLILFGTRAYLQTPLTFDRATVRTMLDEAQIGLAGKDTAIGDAIGLAIKRLRDRPAQSRVVILLTDGANTAGEVEPLEAVKLAADAGLRIYTVGVGADRMEIQTFFGSRSIDPSSDLDEKLLRTIAQTTGGDYFRAKDTQGLEEVYRKLDLLEPTVTAVETRRPVMALFYWPLAGAMALMAMLGIVAAWRSFSEGRAAARESMRGMG